MLMVLLLLPFFLNVFYRYVQELHLSEEFGQGLFHEFLSADFSYGLCGTGSNEISKSALVVDDAIPRELVESLHRGICIYL